MKTTGMKNRIFALLLCLVLLPAAMLSCPVPANAGASGTKAINVPFIQAVEGNVINWDFPYSDDCFFRDHELFDMELARASMGLAVSAFRNDGLGLANQHDTYLKAAGFTDIAPFGYDSPTSADSLSGVIASKRIGDFTLIAAAPAGQGYQKEWGGNFTVGDSARHEGFNNAAKIFEDRIRDYIEDHGLTGKLRLWLTGFSRASAVSNIAAADMIDSGLFEVVYAYLFAVPRTTKEPGMYGGIFNVCGKYDPVAQVPLESWGYERYGIDYFTPSEETDPDYIEHSMLARTVYSAMTGNILRNNPEINHQLRMLIEFLGKMFPESGDFAARFQDTLVSLIQEASIENILPVLSVAMERAELPGMEEEYAGEVFVDYISFILSQHLTEDRRQIKEGKWDPDAKLMLNLMREHSPTIYIAWLFSGLETDELLNGPIYARRVIIEADADVEVILNGEIIGGVDRSGVISYHSGYLGSQADSELKNVSIVRNGQYTVVTVPWAETYRILITTHGFGTAIVHECIQSPFETYGEAGKMQFFSALPGEYMLDAETLEDLSEAYTVRGRMTGYRAWDYEYSPVSEMAMEAASTSHISLKTLLLMLTVTAAFVLALLLACLVIFIAHLRGKKKKGRVYSHWYVIVPHLLLAALFAFLNRFLSVHLFTIPIAAQSCAAAVMALLFLLSLRGMLRNKNAWSITATCGIFVLGAVNVALYFIFGPYPLSTAHHVLYGVVTAVLAALAVLAAFFSGKHKSA